MYAQNFTIKLGVIDALQSIKNSMTPLVLEIGLFVVLVLVGFGGEFVFTFEQIIEDYMGGQVKFRGLLLKTVVELFGCTVFCDWSRLGKNEFEANWPKLFINPIDDRLHSPHMSFKYSFILPTLLLVLLLHKQPIIQSQPTLQKNRT